MIHKVWKGSITGINTLRVYEKLTDDHFIKNAHSRMRVHLSVQILSQNVIRMLYNYCTDDNERLKEYNSLLFMVEKFDTVIDIWNHPLDKKFKRDQNEKRYECIDSSNHKYIEYLESFLGILNFWKAECTVGKKMNEFMSLTLFESFAWMVYGIKGVAQQIPEGCVMIQRAGGSDDLEHEFANFRQKNQNSTMADTRAMMGQQTGFRSTNFARYLKYNNNGDKCAYINELRAEKKRKEY